VYQELLVTTRPDVVIESGTYEGGSALYFATIMELLGDGELITIDVEPQPVRPQHPRISYLTGSSTDLEIFAEVKRRVGNRRVMVVLDSDHTADHVSRELVMYSELVQPGDYIIVEDTNVNGHPTFPEFGPGPMEAVVQFLAAHTEFEVDRSCERFLMTLHPNGYLRRRERSRRSES
jgi:cephalosporin hydroxylase